MKSFFTSVLLVLVILLCVTSRHVKAFSSSHNSNQNFKQLADGHLGGGKGGPQSIERLTFVTKT